MVPFQLPDGSWTQVPLKQAAVLGSRQQSQQSTLSLRRQQMDAHNKRWDSMGKHEAAQDAQRLYNSGAADDNDDLRDEIARRMNLPEGTRLPPHTQGEVRVDANGNYIVVDKRAKTAAPVTQPSETGTPQSVGSMQGALERGRNARNAAGIASREKIATLPQRPRPVGQGAARSLPAGIQEKLAKGRGEIEDYKSQLTQMDDDIAAANKMPDKIADPLDPSKTISRNELLTRLGRKRASKVAEARKRMLELDALDPENEWGSGTGGYPYRKPKAGASTSDLNQPIYGTPKEDPKLRKYADTYFNGNYKAAQDAVRKQRGQ
jgi:hypothetical protein